MYKKPIKITNHFRTTCSTCKGRYVSKEDMMTTYHGECMGMATPIEWEGELERKKGKWILNIPWSNMLET